MFYKYVDTHFGAGVSNSNTSWGKRLESVLGHFWSSRKISSQITGLKLNWAEGRERQSPGEAEPHHVSHRKIECLNCLTQNKMKSH